jgi:NADH-quinone oxidoreductase subunit C
MDAHAIVDLIKDVVPEGAVEAAVAADGMPLIYVAREHVDAICRELRDRPELRFALASDITAVDLHPREPRFEVVVHLASLGVSGFGSDAKRLRIKVRVPGTEPRMPTLSGVWKSMNWGEREVYDMFGIHFDGHPDLRRILMPEDWDGHPARKDYPVQIKKPYAMYEPLQLTAEQFAANVRATRDKARQE